MGEKEVSYSFPDHHQNYWQLASIQSASMGIPGIIIGSQIAAQYGSGTAITSVIIGNLILWIIGLAIITMAAPRRSNALQNINQYLGKAGSLFAAFFLILAFLSWYILQLDSANKAIKHLLLSGEDQLRVGAGVGAFIALLSIGGIQLIKKYCVFIFPLLLIFIGYSSFNSLAHFQVQSFWKFSLLGIISVMLASISGIINMPTFFRHSRSRHDSYLGLSLMIFFSMIFQVYAIIVDFQSLLSNVPENLVFSIFLGIFIILSLISINLVNIYFASAGWEMIFPHRKSNKEFVIVGLLGTMAYTFFQISSPIQFLLTIAQNFIAGLGVVLIMSFLMRTFTHHKPRPYEKMISCSCWFFGGITGIFFSSSGDRDSSNVLMISFNATSLAFLFFIFFEESYRSVRKILKKAT